MTAALSAITAALQKSIAVREYRKGRDGHFAVLTDMRRKKRIVRKGAALLLAAAMLLTACGETQNPADAAGSVSESKAAADSSSVSDADHSSDAPQAVSEGEGSVGTASRELTTTEGLENAPEIAGLTCESRMVLSYAECFDVYYYSDGYKLIDVHDSGAYLLVPEGKQAPEGLDEKICVLLQPLDTIYMAATSPMALFGALDAIDTIRLSGVDASGWYVQGAVDALNSGEMKFAGKYNEPDYELLISENCDLAIESTMILHDPKVQEMIEMLEIPVFIDRSSYESHPLGRTEWIMAYAAMLNREEEAAAFFREQAGVLDRLSDFVNTEKTVTFFYLNTSGAAVVRNPEDYISSMIELGGGRNTFADLKDDSGKTSVPVTMEEFYATAVDSDYLIYNSSIDATVNSVADLVARDALFADFKAVKEGNVWTTEKSMYQSTDTIGQLINDINLMLTDGDPSRMLFLRKLS